MHAKSRGSWDRARADGGSVIAVNDDQRRGSEHDLVIRFYRRLWNPAYDAAIEDMLTRDIIFSGSLGQTPAGRDGWRDYRDHIRHAAPDFRNEVLDLIAADD